jgi:hypothetical protein
MRTIAYRYAAVVGLTAVALITVGLQQWQDRRRVGTASGRGERHLHV